MDCSAQVDLKTTSAVARTTAAVSCACLLVRLSSAVAPAALFHPRLLALPSGLIHLSSDAQTMPSAATPLRTQLALARWPGLLTANDLPSQRNCHRLQRDPRPTLHTRSRPVSARPWCVA